jgi:hypothetical protein
MVEASALPLLFKDALESLGMKSVDEWWLGLRESEQEGMLDLWSDCQTPGVTSSPRSGQRMVARFEGYFDDDLDGQPVFWHDDFYEFLVNHEEYVFREIPFHVCFRQPEALAAIKAGEIRPDFQCPLHDTGCPMMQSPAITRGSSMKITLRFAPPDKPTPSRDLTP